MAKQARATAPPEESVDADRVLAFVNTLSARVTDAPVERLVSYDALVDWAREQHLIPAAAAERLVHEGRRHPHQAAVVLARAREFREAINGLAVSIDQERQPGPAVLATIGECLAAAYANGRLVPHQGALQWVAGADDDLNRILWEIGRAAGRLVLSPRLSRIRACAASDCGWWFVDDTKNRSRRWCDMKICGNREKVRRFRHKN
ncbi:MAG: CGNR zinc finger domain-containing protein [Vicinamibacterales bacterium]